MLRFVANLLRSVKQVRSTFNWRCHVQEQYLGRRIQRQPFHSQDADPAVERRVPEMTNPATRPHAVLVASGMREPDLITRRRFRTGPSGEIWPTEGYQGGLGEI